MHVKDSHQINFKEFEVKPPAGNILLESRVSGYYMDVFVIIFILYSLLLSK